VIYTLGKPPVLTRSGLTYGVFFETGDFAASSTLIVPVVGVVVSVAVAAVSFVGDDVVGWGGELGTDVGLGCESTTGSGWTRSRPRELGGGSGVAMPNLWIAMIGLGYDRSTRALIRLRNKVTRNTGKPNSEGKPGCVTGDAPSRKDK
jgi:hypothetical protein